MMINNRGNENFGFTLMEIVAVLVLLGIAAAVSVPKFFDLNDSAEERAAISAIKEAQSRINYGYSQAVYLGKTCKEALEGVNTIGKISDKENGKETTTINGFVFLEPEMSELLLEGKDKVVKVQKINGKKITEGSLILPSCTQTENSGTGTSGSDSDSGSGGASSGGGLVCPDIGAGTGKCEGNAACVGGTCECTCTCSNGVTECVCDVKSVDSGSESGGNCSLDMYISGIKCIDTHTMDGLTDYRIGHGSPIETVNGVYIVINEPYVGSAVDMNSIITDPEGYIKEHTKDYAVVPFVKFDVKNKRTDYTKHPDGNVSWKSGLKSGDFYISDDGAVYIWPVDNKVPEWGEWTSLPPVETQWVKIVDRYNTIK